MNFATGPELIESSSDFEISFNVCPLTHVFRIRTFTFQVKMLNAYKMAKNL